MSTTLRSHNEPRSLKNPNYIKNGEILMSFLADALKKSIWWLNGSKFGYKYAAGRVWPDANVHVNPKIHPIMRFYPQLSSRGAINHLHKKVQDMRWHQLAKRFWLNIHRICYETKKLPNESDSGVCWLQVWLWWWKRLKLVCWWRVYSRQK